MYLGGLGEGSMTWVITLDLWAAKLGTKEEMDVAQVDRLRWEQLKGRRLTHKMMSSGRGVHLAFSGKLNLCEIEHPAGVMWVEVGASAV